MKTASALVITTAVIAVFAAPRISHSQTAERGRAIFHALTQKYPKMQPCGWGLATANPRLALFIPQTEWAELPWEDQASLTLYVESLIPAVRANPDRYLAPFRNDPLRPVFRAKVAHLCAECWLIGVGPFTFDEQGVLYEKVVIEGDLAWERDDPRSRGVKASEFRRGLGGVALASKETDQTEQRQQGIVAIAEHAPNAELAVRASRGTGQSMVQASSNSGSPVDLGSQSRDRRAVDSQGQSLALAEQAQPPRQRREGLAEEARRKAEEEHRKSEEARTQLGQMGRSYSGTTLIESAENGDTPMVELLLTAGMSPQAKDPKGWTALMYAAWNGHTATVWALLDRGADVNAISTDGTTALMTAASQGYTQIAKVLIAKGAAVDARRADGWTALIWAAAEGQEESVRILLASGAQIDATDSHGITPLIYAAANMLEEDPTGKTLPVVKALLSNGAAVDLKAADGSTALMWAAKKGEVAIAQALLASGAHVNATDGNGKTPLIYAASGKAAPPIAEALIASGADVNMKDSSGATALMRATRRRKPGMLQTLLAKGADPNATDNQGATALMIAAQMGRTHNLRALLQGRADRNLKDKRGRTATDIALEHHHNTIWAFLSSEPE